MAPPDGRVTYDARLVIDLITDAGATESYYADGTYLLSADSRLARAIDETFRRRIIAPKIRSRGDPMSSMNRRR